MKQRLKNLVLVLVIALSSSIMLAPAVVNADLKGDACEGVNSLNGIDSSTCSQSADRSVNNIGRTVIQIFSVIVGFISVIMVIIGGLRLITANGDASATAAARTAIIYALVGLMVVAFAQVLVHFVIFKTQTALNPPPAP